MDKAKIAKAYVSWRCVLMRGHGEVSLVMSIVSPTLIIWLTLRDAVTIARIHALWIIPSLIVLAVIVQFAIGWVWDKKKLVNYEQEWLMDRTEAIQELLKKNDNV